MVGAAGLSTVRTAIGEEGHQAAVLAFGMSDVTATARGRVCLGEGASRHVTGGGKASRMPHVTGRSFAHS
jgi:hypothetical protein